MATSENGATKKKKLKWIEKNEDNIIESKKDKRKGMKLSRLRKKRLIIRNLSFKVKKEELKKIFSKFGEVVDIQVPEKPDGKKKGFAFVQFKDTKPMIKAMKELNFQKINGRPIAIDFAVNKNTYVSRLNTSNSGSKRKSVKQEITEEEELEDSDDESVTHSVQNVSKQEIKSEEETEDSDDDESIKSESASQEICDDTRADVENDAKVKAFLKEFDADDDDDELQESESSDESSEDDERDYSDVPDNSSNISNTESRPYKRKESEDIAEGKTVFIRNISFKNTEEDLQDVVEEYGEIVYCLFCNDPITGHFRGTAFVKFKEKESAEKLIEKSSEEPGIVLDGRKLVCAHAVSREESLKTRDSSEKNRDKRNLRLLKCGLIAYGSKEAEGVSQTDMAKRAQLEAVKKQKLRNVNFFISDKRLICHNVPKNLNDKDLYKLFKKAGGEGAVVTKARIMKDFTKTDAQGNAVSRGFAFITFTEHEHALKALNELNNNPNIFTASKRPIVEFSVENKVALLSQERRREKIKMQNKKRAEQSNSQDSQATNNQQSSETMKFKRPKNQKKFKQSDGNGPSPKEKMFQKKNKQSDTNGPFEEAVSPKKKKKQKKGRRKQKQHANEKSEISALTQMYKEKLLNKYS